MQQAASTLGQRSQSSLLPLSNWSTSAALKAAFQDVRHGLSFALVDWLRREEGTATPLVS